ncbi:MAG TPA: 5'-methylthioadenosine/adenosylhomocysteine nucleosidase [Natronincola sp.]|nr:5'-methylthioadenosine/adenosylhomocysteine nucleosidase [Natronincola sp.]
MANKVAIIGAMEEEVEALYQNLLNINEHETNLPDLPVFTGILSEKEVIIARCGIGKVNAALATQYIINTFNPDFIINTGVAGGVSPKVRIADFVVGQSSLQHDFDARYFGYPMGTIPRLKTSVFLADSRMVELCIQAAGDELGQKRVHRGLIVSGDQFVASTEQKKSILEFFPDTMCVEMEGAAIAQVAHLNQIPHIIIRAISDQADNSAPKDFNQYLLEIIPELNRVIQRLLNLI